MQDFAGLPPGLAREHFCFFILKAQQLWAHLIWPMLSGDGSIISESFWVQVWTEDSDSESPNPVG